MIRLRDIFVTNRLFAVLTINVILFVLSFLVPFLFYVSQAALAAIFIALVADYFLLAQTKKKVSCSRQIAPLLPLGDEMPVKLLIHYSGKRKVSVLLIDEWPEQLQKRDFSVPFSLSPGEYKLLEYPVRAVERSLHIFGRSLLYLSTRIGFLQYRQTFETGISCPVYPSVIQVKKHELMLSQRNVMMDGVKKLRRIGHSYEFEQIKNYTAGDDIRSINWKATGRRSGLMVNQYGDEKSQQVYSLIDKSRSMQLPFEGLTLMEYAINTSLVISAIALNKYDKAGLVTFDERVDTLLKASRKPGQLKAISETLAREEASAAEANFEQLYQVVKQVVKQRSLLILYTNFESYYSLERVLPVLRYLNRMHLLLVVFFKNTEIESFTWQPAEDINAIYHQTVAKRFMMEKDMIARELARYSIQCIQTTPAELSVATLNKYLEFKSKGWI